MDKLQFLVLVISISRKGHPAIVHTGTVDHPHQPGLSTYICHDEKYIEVLTYVPVAHSKFYRPFRVGAEACRDVASLPLKAHRLLGENNMIIHTSSRVQLGEALKRAGEGERAAVYSCS